MSGGSRYLEAGLVSDESTLAAPAYVRHVCSAELKNERRIKKWATVQLAQPQVNEKAEK